MNGKLLKKTKMGASIADLGGNVFFAVINYWLMYYFTDMVGLSAALAGTSLLIGKIWDAVIDPFIGYASDHAKSRWGRRKVFMVASLIPLVITVILLFTKINISEQIVLAIYYVSIYCLVNTFYSLIFIPYYSLLTELTDDYNERTSLQAYRIVCAVLGSIFGSVLAQPIIKFFADERTGFTMMAVIFSAVISVSVLITVFSVKESKSTATVSKTGVLSFFRAYKDVFKNTPYILTVLAGMLSFIGMVITQTSLPYFFKYYLKQENLAPIGILVFALSCVAFVPVVGAVSKRIGKKATWIGGLSLVGVGSILIFLAAPLGLPLMLACMVIVGAGTSAGSVLLFSVVSDCVDLDYLNTGERKEGTFIGFLIFVQQLGTAFGAAVVGWILGALGYIADATQTPAVINGIRMLMGLLPGCISIAALVLLMFYPISKKKHDEIIRQIEEKEGGKSI